MIEASFVYVYHRGNPRGDFDAIGGAILYMKKAVGDAVPLYLPTVDSQSSYLVGIVCLCLVGNFEGLKEMSSPLKSV